MKQDIRKIFKEKKLYKKKLPSFHQDEFLEKLEEFNKKRIFKTSLPFLKIAVSIVLILIIGYYFSNSFVEIKRENEPTLLAQVKQIEKEYLNNIDKEWDSFIQIANDNDLVKKYQGKIKESNINYEKILKKLKLHPNNITVIKSLINNLQRRLNLIQEIKEHLKELNQKNKSNETIYL